MKPQDEISEKEFQARVVELATLLGWRTLHVYPLRSKAGPRTPTTIAGWPDLFLWNPRHPARGFVALELKSATGQVTLSQAQVLAQLGESGARTMIARPADFDAVHALLAR